MNILVIDIGTTSIRGILFDARGEMLDSHSIFTPVKIFVLFHLSPIA